jgi:general secretion pathway protein J
MVTDRMTFAPRSSTRPSHGRRRLAREGESGFTLLELMISLTLLGVMLAMVYSVFATALAAVPRGEDVAASSARMRAATSLLSRQVRSMVSYPLEGEDESTPCLFFGDASWFQFVTSAPQHNGGEGLASALYWTDGRSLWLREEVIVSPATLTGEQSIPTSEVRLMDGLASVRFQYLRLDGTDSEWRDSWDPFEEQTLPGAIRVTIDGLGVGNSYWIQEIPVMLVSYALGSYDCEGGFGRDAGENGGTSRDIDREDNLDLGGDE